MKQLINLVNEYNSLKKELIDIQIAIQIINAEQKFETIELIFKAQYLQSTIDLLQPFDEENINIIKNILLEKQIKIKTNIEQIENKIEEFEKWKAKKKVKKKLKI